MGEELLPCRGSDGPFHSVNLPRINVQSVLTLLWKLDAERHLAVADGLTDELCQLLLIRPVLVKCGHEVGEGSGHLEVDSHLPPGKDEGVRVT